MSTPAPIPSDVPRSELPTRRAPGLTAARSGQRSPASMRLGQGPVGPDIVRDEPEDLGAIQIHCHAAPAEVRS